MKQWHWTVVLVLVCAGMAAYCYKFERGEVPEGPLVFKFDPEKCTRVELTPKQDETTADTTDKSKPPVVLVKSGDQWKIEKPFAARADQEKVTQLLDKVKDLVIKDAISNDPEAGKLDLADYGLDKPSASLTVHLEGGETKTLLFGRKSIDSTKVYTMKKGEKAVFLTTTALFDETNKQVDDFRDKDALSFDKKQVMKVRLTRENNKLELEKRNLRLKEADDTATTTTSDSDEKKEPEYEYDWWLTKPVEARGTKWDCDSVVTKLDDLKIDKWVDNNPKNLAQYGLNAPVLKAEVYVGKEKRPRSLLIGKAAKDETDKFYAKNSLDKPVFLVAKSVLEDLKKEAKDLRDKDVLNFQKDEVEKFSVKAAKLDVLCRKTARGDQDLWMMVRPREVGADKKAVDDFLWDLDGVRANEFIDSPGEDKDYGLDKPRYTVKVWVKGQPKEQTLLVGNTTAEDDGLYVKLDGDKTVYEVGKTIQDKLTALDAKKLRDRTVIKFTRDDLRQLELKFGKTHVTLVKSGFDWKLTKPKEEDADSTAVSNLLWKFEDFHADEYVGPAPKDLKKYGFDKPQAEVTFYVKGKKPQTVVLGKATADKVYVMLKGADSVFKHSDSLLDDVRKDEADLKKK